MNPSIMEPTYVIGHKSPDTDTVVCAVAMADLLSKRDGSKFIAARTAKVNSETEYVFEKANAQLPQVLENAEDKKLFLVDHNEKDQWVQGADVENIVGIVDHHKFNFSGGHPIEIILKPWGCCSTVIYDIYQKENITIPKDIKTLLLGALLSDTVILKSPTTTPKDEEVLKTLANELGIDYEQMGMEQFKAKAQVADKSPIEILENDYKEFDFSGMKAGVGQLEMPDLSDVMDKIPAIIQEMQKKEMNCILMLTDIIQEGSKLVIVGDEAEAIANAFNTTLTNSVSEFIPAMMSRKKQIVPVLTALWE